MERQKTVILGTLMLSVFIFIVSIMALYVQEHVQSGSACNCTFPLPYCIPFVASIGLFIGSGVAYLVLPKNQPGIELVKKLVGKEEWVVLKVVLDHNYKTTQAKITQESGLPKVKVFRILERLREQGIVCKENRGKVRIIQLSEEFKKYL